MNKESNLGPLLIILTVLLVALGGYYTREGKWGEVLSRFGIDIHKSNLTLEQAAAPGRVIEGFPIEFLGIVRDARTVDSGRYVDKEGITVLVTTYETNAPISDMFAGYVNFLADHNYEIVRADAKSGVAFLSALSDDWKVMVEMNLKDARTSTVEVIAERVLE
jgi:hypothetical protein